MKLLSSEGDYRFYSRGITILALKQGRYSPHSTLAYSHARADSVNAHSCADLLRPPADGVVGLQYGRARPQDATAVLLQDVDEVAVDGCEKVRGSGGGGDGGRGRDGGGGGRKDTSAGIKCPWRGSLLCHCAVAHCGLCCPVRAR